MNENQLDDVHEREVNDSERMRELDLNDEGSIGQGSIGTQGDSVPHNMSPEIAEGNAPRSSPTYNTDRLPRPGRGHSS